MKYLTLILFISSIQVLSAKEIEDIERELIGLWSGPSINYIPEHLRKDGYKYQQQELEYIIFRKNNKIELYIRSLSDDIVNLEWNGKYKLIPDKKKNTYQIKLNDKIIGLGNKFIELISISDTSLILKSTLNPTEAVFNKNPLPEDKVLTAKSILYGTFDFIFVANNVDPNMETPYPLDFILSKENELEMKINDTIDKIVTFRFEKDSVELLLNKNNTKLKLPYILKCQYFSDKCAAYIPQLKLIDPNNSAYVFFEMKTLNDYNILNFGCEGQNVFVYRKK